MAALRAQQVFDLLLLTAAAATAAAAARLIASFARELREPEAAFNSSRL